MADMTSCEWCGSRHRCDCQERLACQDAGSAGHFQCGKRECCDAPKWVTCEHALAKLRAEHPELLALEAKGSPEPVPQ